MKTSAAIGTAIRPVRLGLLESPLQKSRLGDVAFSRGRLDEFHGALCQWLRSEDRESHKIGYVNPHVFNLAVHNGTLRAFLDRADIVTVDGLGIALAALLLTRRRQPRTVMTALFDQVLATPSLPHLTAALIGGTEEIVARGATAMNRTSPWMEIIKTCHGYAPLAEHLEFLRSAPATGLVLVAMGSPRSEELIERVAGQVPGKLFWNIGGGTLHFYAGTLRRVPAVVSRLGLQWGWRMLHEPRTVPRYLVGIPLFLRSVLRLLLRPRNR